MKRDEDRALWDLLGRARQPRLSPFFARDILRRLREEPGPVDQLRSWFKLRWIIPATVAASAVLLTITLSQYRTPPVSDPMPEAVVKIDPQDYEVVADLDALIASDENGLWDDDQTL